MMAPPRIFDRRLYALRRARARGTTFLVQEVAAHIAERIGSFGRRFERALDLSSRPESFTELRISADHWIRTALVPPGVEDVGEGVAVADEEALPFAPDSFDLVTSVLSLHAVNDLPGSLIQLRRALRPGGLFMGAMFGGETLKELRAAFSAGESQITAGASLRVAPLADLRDLGALLQRAGFVRPVTDTERTVVRYCDFTSLVADLRKRAGAVEAAVKQVKPVTVSAARCLRRRTWPLRGDTCRARRTNTCDVRHNLSDWDGALTSQRTSDLIVELGRDSLAQEADRGNNRDADKRGNEAVFDSGCPPLILRKVFHSISRSIGMSGRSAGGIG